MFVHCDATVACVCMGTRGVKSYENVAFHQKPPLRAFLPNSTPTAGQRSDTEQRPESRIWLKDTSAGWKAANHAHPLVKGRFLQPLGPPLPLLLCENQPGWFTHRARSSLDGGRCNSWTVGTETLHQEGAPSPCCPSSDAGLSLLKHCNQTGGRGEERGGV